MKRAILLFPLTALLLIGSPDAAQGLVPAQSEINYDLSWWTVDGGGTTLSTGGVYVFGGTAGQPDAAAWAGPGYTLVGGFWGGSWREHRIYLPLVLRGT